MDDLVEALETVLGGRRVPRSARAQPGYEIEITPELSLWVKGHFEVESLARFERVADLLRDLLLGGVPQPEKRGKAGDDEGRPSDEKGR